ncbi:MAG: hypothetical protein ABI597_00270 [Gammaproteobacteria bacterium]
MQDRKTIIITTLAQTETKLKSELQRIASLNPDKKQTKLFDETLELQRSLFTLKEEMGSVKLSDENKQAEDEKSKLRMITHFLDERILKGRNLDYAAAVAEVTIEEMVDLIPPILKANRIVLTAEDKQLLAFLKPQLAVEHSFLRGVTQVKFTRDIQLDKLSQINASLQKLSDEIIKLSPVPTKTPEATNDVDPAKQEAKIAAVSPKPDVIQYDEADQITLEENEIKVEEPILEQKESNYRRMIKWFENNDITQALEDAHETLSNLADASESVNLKTAILREEVAATQENILTHIQANGQLRANLYADANKSYRAIDSFCETEAKKLSARANAEHEKLLALTSPAVMEKIKAQQTQLALLKKSLATFFGLDINLDAPIESFVVAANTVITAKKTANVLVPRVFKDLIALESRFGVITQVSRTDQANYLEEGVNKATVCQSNADCKCLACGKKELLENAKILSAEIDVYEAHIQKMGAFTERLEAIKSSIKTALHKQIEKENQIQLQREQEEKENNEAAQRTAMEQAQQAAAPVDILPIPLAEEPNAAIFVDNVVAQNPVKADDDEARVQIYTDAVADYRTYLEGQIKTEVESYYAKFKSDKSKEFAGRTVIDGNVTDQVAVQSIYNKLIGIYGNTDPGEISVQVTASSKLLDDKRPKLESALAKLHVVTKLQTHLTDPDKALARAKYYGELKLPKTKEIFSKRRDSGWNIFLKACGVFVAGIFGIVPGILVGYSIFVKTPTKANKEILNPGLADAEKHANRPGAAG